MKPILRLMILVLILLALPAAISAQGSDVIVLNDATPSVNIVVTLPADATGVVALDFMNVTVRMTDASANTIFYAADPRLHALELSIAPNSGGHNLILERTPGVAEGYVRVNALAQLTDYTVSAPQIGADFQLVSDAAQIPAQAQLMTLNSAQPGNTVNIALPNEQIGVISAAFNNTQATTQLVDGAGVLMASSLSGHVDGINAIVDGGAYMFTILSQGLVQDVQTRISAQPIVYSQEFFPAQVVSATTADTVSASNCMATISVSSVSLRSGPGAGYSVTGYGFGGETLPVGGSNAGRGWFVVGKDGRSAWVFGGGVQLSGACDALSVFNVPFRDAPQAPVIIVTQPPQYVGGGSGGTVLVGTGSYDDDDDHDDDDHDHGDDEGDDD
ncbi:MAG: hypothetical protein IPK19_24650 [Chloroflexi bacterium]|nr:hypothetical protein [Chloroflexota bacterium]